jgi:hypothetical protein
MEITNIYQELGISTSVTKKEDILSEIDKAIKTWQNRVNNPKYKLQAPDHTAALRKIKTEIEANPSIIKQHASAYAEIEKRERIEKEKELRKVGNLYVQNGEIVKEYLTILVNKFKLTEQEVLAILGAKIKVKSPEGGDDGIPELPRETMGKIATNLAALNGPKDLYDFLGVGKNASVTVISAKVDEIAKQVSQNPHKTDPKVCAQKALTDLSRDILKDATKRKSYDQALENIPFAPIAETIRNLKAGCAFIDKETYQKLLQAATGNGVPLAKAIILIKKTAASVSLPIASSDDVASNMVQCRFCNLLSPKGTKTCQGCGMPLTVVCPNCGKTSKDEELTCPSCNFAFADMMRAPEFVKLVEAALADRDYISAIDGIKKLERVWKTHPQLPSLRKKCGEIQIEYDKILDELKGYCKKKLYYTAKTAMLRIPSSPQMVQLQEEILSATNEVEKLLTAAVQIQDANLRIDKYMQILSICADCEKAKAAISSTPPAPPTSISMNMNGSTAHLSWNKLNSQYVEYCVIRKEGGRPTSVTDGTQMVVTSNTQFDDSSLTYGASFYYAVYSKCGEIFSMSAVLTDKPALAVCELDLKKMSYDIQKNSIGFNMVIPPKAKAVEIYRDGVLITTVRGSSYMDSGLLPDHEYLYKFVVVFEDCVSGKHRSNGVTLKLKAMSPPTPVDLRIEPGEKEAKLSWAKPAQGALAIFVSDKPLPYHVNDLVNLDMISLPKLNITGTSCIIPKDFSGKRYYLPLTIQGNIAVAGKNVSLVSVVKPSGVQFDRNDSFVNVSWNWDKISALRIEINTGTANPQIVDLDSKNSNAQYKVVFPKDAKSVTISVRSRVQTSDGEILLSDADERTFNLSMVKVAFISVTKALFNSSKYTIELAADSILPGKLSLLISEDFAPNDLVNFTSYLDIEPADLKPGVTLSKSFFYKRKMKGKPVFFRLIIADQKLARMVSIAPGIRIIN